MWCSAVKKCNSEFVQGKTNIFPDLGVAEPWRLTRLLQVRLGVELQREDYMIQVNQRKFARKCSGNRKY